jgi:hypothetical protein
LANGEKINRQRDERSIPIETLEQHFLFSIAMLTDALVVSKAGAPFKFQEIEVNDNLHDNEVLIRMKATGVCHTDLNFSNETSIPGLFPAVFGHEGKPFYSLYRFLFPQSDYVCLNTIWQL